jgi:hypothetical protein
LKTYAVTTSLGQWFCATRDPPTVAECGLVREALSIACGYFDVVLSTIDAGLFGASGASDEKGQQSKQSDGVYRT